MLRIRIVTILDPDPDCGVFKCWIRILIVGFLNVGPDRDFLDLFIRIVTFLDHGSGS